MFIKNGFKSCGADQCVYVKQSQEGFIYVGLYVDDMIIAARTSSEINQVKVALKNDYIDTKNQIADMLTKALGTKRLTYLFQASGIGPRRNKY